MTAANKITEQLKRYPAAAHVFPDEQPKKNGGTRPIAKPNKPLKKWLRRTNKLLNEHYPDWPPFLHGGIRRRSYVTYARPHVNKQCVITVDITACFDSITQTEVRGAIEKHLGLGADISIDLAKKLCFKSKVPQGFATSNFLCNLYLLDSLTTLNASFNGRNLDFGNYVDDIVVSGTISDPSQVVNEISVELSRAKLKTNKAKVRVMPRTGRQEVCGLLVNRRISLTHALKAKLLSDVANHRISEASLGGWLVNLRQVDTKFGNKLRKYAQSKKYPNL